MSNQSTEIYHPRAVSDHGTWIVGLLQFKVYGLLAEDKSITDNMLSKARKFVNDDVLPRVTAEGQDNGLGFVIVHAGDTGVSISAHWWIQGSVLCQHIHRQLYDAENAMDTIARPVIACVWELAIINAEQKAWRKTMMVSDPDRVAYLECRADLLVT